MIDLREIVKAYDVRGVVPDQLDPDVARAVGAAFVDVVFGEPEPANTPAGDRAARRIVVARDMRPSGPDLVAAFATGAAARGADVVDVGLGSTDLLYFASGSMDVPGAMFTASHNPARYNGIKMCRPGAAPVGADTGLTQIRERAQAYLEDSQSLVTVDPPGTLTEQSILDEYAAYLRGLVDLRQIRPLRVVVDAGNGMAGLTAPAVLGEESPLGPLPLHLVPMYFELDGTFPNHEANPLDPANLVDLQRMVVEAHGDIGLAFDGDADRCFVVDETGAAVSPSAITGLVAERELAKAPGANVIHNLITSRAVPEIIGESGGVAVRTRVGHSYIKAEMARTDAVFGGEHSAHYYFRDFWRADTGMLAALHVLAALGEQDRPLSELVARYERYADSGEINSEVDDQAARTAAVRDHFADRTTAVDELDGLTLDLGDGAWLNVRASNTEPLLRLNVEARDEPTMTTIRDEALAVIRS